MFYGYTNWILMHIKPEERRGYGQNIVGGICMHSNGGLISPHENENKLVSSHMFHDFVLTFMLVLLIQKEKTFR